MPENTLTPQQFVRLFLKMIPWLPRRLRLALAGRGIRRLPVGPGLRMNIDTANDMDRGFYLRTYDSKLYGLVRGWLRPGDAALDVGAHKGYVALLLARAVGPSGRVFAFEPDPRVRALTEEHRNLNRLDQVSILPWALGDCAETRTFYLSRRMGWSSAFPNEAARDTLLDEVRVPFRSLDELAQAGEVAWPAGRLRFLKLDCEGSEELALRGMRGLLEREHPAIWMEINRGSLSAAGTTARALAAELGRYSYRFHRARWHTPLAGPKGLWLDPVPDPDAVPDEVYDVVALAAGDRAALRPLGGEGALLLELGWTCLLVTP